MLACFTVAETGLSRGEAFTQTVGVRTADGLEKEGCFHRKLRFHSSKLSYNIVKVWKSRRSVKHPYVHATMETATTMNIHCFVLPGGNSEL